MHSYISTIHVGCLPWFLTSVVKDIKQGVGSQIYTGDPRTCAFLSPHGDQIGGLQGFPVIKITVVGHVHMLPASTAA